MIVWSTVFPVASVAWARSEIAPFAGCVTRAAQPLPSRRTGR